MVQICTRLSKLSSAVIDGSVIYNLPVHSISEGCDDFDLRSLLKQSISIEFTGRINCVLCGRAIKKTFGDGFCYPCFQSAPENSPCIIRPELCEGHLGKGRDVEWEERNHVQPHVLYLAYTSGYKVGVTRKCQVPQRWVDQGALAGAVVLEAPYRRLAGEAEVAMKAFYNDRTSWQAMLKAQKAPALSDFKEVWHELVGRLKFDYGDYCVAELNYVELNYPIAASFSAKISSILLTKIPSFSGVLVAIKGQYLIFENGCVLNVRRHAGFEVAIKGH